MENGLLIPPPVDLVSEKECSEENKEEKKVN
jgi:hypothetical protein